MSRDSMLRDMHVFERDGWSVEPSSYQIRNPDGTPGGWIAQAHVWHTEGRDTVAQAVLEREPRVYDTESEANAIAFKVGYAWLKQHAA